MWPSNEKTLTLQVSDQGKGIPVERSIATSFGTNHGVGLSGMRERARELGGSLEIQSTENGTTVTAAFPVNSAAVVGV
jgi:signal transduction histidine kinase